MKQQPKATRSVQALMSDFHRALEHRYIGIITQTSPELHAEQFDGFTHEQLSGLAAYIFLPKNDEERHTLIVTFETDPALFADIDRKAIGNYIKHGPEIRLRYGLDWRNCLKDTTQAVDLPPETIPILDTVSTYLQMPQGDPHERFNMLLRNALHMHIIPADVFAKLHDDVFDFLKPPPRVDLELFRNTIERMKHTALGQVVEEDSIPVIEATRAEVAESGTDVQTPVEETATIAAEPTDKGRTVHIWYERLVELSGEPDTDSGEKASKPKTEEKKSEKKDAKKEKKVKEPEQNLKQRKDDPAKKSGEEKRRDLLGKLQVLGNF